MGDLRVQIPPKFISKAEKFRDSGASWKVKDSN